MRLGRLSIIRPRRHLRIPRKELWSIFRRRRQAVRHARNYRADCGPQRVEEYRAEYGQTLCRLRTDGGWAVGIVANQKKNVHGGARHGRKRIEFGE